MNGLMTYDRAVIKMDAARITAAARKLHGTPPAFRTLVADARTKPATWRYTTEKPAAGWEKAEFDDSSWKSGEGGFGEKTTPGSVVRTEWKTPDIWVRRTFDLPEGVAPSNVYLVLHHDEDAEVYLNGVLAVKEPGYSTSYSELPLTAEGAAALRPGKNTIAIHCKQTGGGQYIDAGLAEVKAAQ